MAQISRATLLLYYYTVGDRSQIFKRNQNGIRNINFSVQIALFGQHFFIIPGEFQKQYDFGSHGKRVEYKNLKHSSLCIMESGYYKAEH